MHKKVLFTLFALMIFTVILGACSIKDVSQLQKGVTAEMGPTKFLQPEVKVKKGDKLTLANTSGVNHIITNGTWDGSTQKPAKEDGAPTVNVNSSSGSVQVGPFNTAGTFKLYCTIHQGMNLTVVVS